MGEDDILDRHDAEYLPDISRLFKLLEHMLDMDYLIAPGDSGNSYADEVTLVGKSVPEMLDLRFCKHPGYDLGGDKRMPKKATAKRGGRRVLLARRVMPKPVEQRPLRPGLIGRRHQPLSQRDMEGFV